MRSDVLPASRLRPNTVRRLPTPNLNHPHTRKEASETQLFRPVPYMFYIRGMARFAPDPTLVAIAKEALACAPGWAGIGLAFCSNRLKDAALLELACVVVDHLEHPLPVASPDQLILDL